jgi:hypothetical protein
VLGDEDGVGKGDGAALVSARPTRISSCSCSPAAIMASVVHRRGPAPPLLLVPFSLPRGTILCTKGTADGAAE